MTAEQTWKKSFPQQAATASVAAPIIAFVLGFLTRGQAVEDIATARILIGVNWSLIFVGFLLAVTALATMRRPRIMAILPAAVLGLVLNAACTAAIVCYFLIAPSDRPAGGHDARRYVISPQQWKHFSSVDGRFAIEMPGEPRIELLQTHAGGRDLVRSQSHHAAVTLPDGSAFRVTWLDPPVLESATTAEAQTLLDNLVAHRISGNIVLENRSIELAGHSAREIRMQMPGRNGPVVTIERDYVIGRRTYQVLVEMGAAEVEGRNADIKRFFDSFSAIEENP